MATKICNIENGETFSFTESGSLYVKVGSYPKHTYRKAMNATIGSSPGSVYCANQIWETNPGRKVIHQKNIVAF